MAVAVSTLIREALRLLSESLNSTVAAMGDGSGGISDSNDFGMLQACNNGVVQICRTCVAVPGAGSKSGVTAAVTPLGDLTVTGSGTMWAARAVQWNSTEIIRIDADELDAEFSNTDTTTGVPAYWYRAGNERVGLYPVPATAGTIRVMGLITPAPAAATTDSFSFLPDERLKYLVPRYMALEAAQKSLEDNEMPPRAAIYQSEYERERMILRSQIPPVYRNEFLSMEPVASVAGKRK